MAQGSLYFPNSTTPQVLTASTSTLGQGIGSWTMAFFLRFVALPATSGTLLGGKFISNDATAVQTLGTVGDSASEPQCLFAMYNANKAGYFDGKYQPIVTGVTNHFMMSYDGSGTSYLWTNGSLSYSTTKTSTYGNSNGPSSAFILGPEAITAGVEFVISDLVVANNYIGALNGDDALALLSGTPPATWAANNNITAWSAWSLQGTVGVTPSLSDGAFTDLGPLGNNFTSVSGSLSSTSYWTGGVLEVLPSALIQAPYSDTLGYQIFIPIVQNPSLTIGGPTQITQIQNLPAFALNGDSLSDTQITQIPLDGVTYFLSFMMATPLQPTDVLTMECEDAWALWSGGLIAGTGGSPLTIVNNSSQNIESLYDIAPANRTFQAGFDMFYGGYTNPGQLSANWANRIPAGKWTNTVSLDSNLLPSVITSQAISDIAASLGDGVDASSIAGIYGYWTIQFSDDTPGVSVDGAEGAPQLTVGMNAFSVPLTAISGLSMGPTWNPSTLMFDSTLVFNCQLGSSTPTNYGPQQQMTVSSISPVTGQSGHYNVSIKNLVITPSSPNAPSDSFYDAYLGVGTPNNNVLGIEPWMTNKYAGVPAYRAIPIIATTGAGDANYIYGSDYTHPLLTETNWGIQDTLTVQITEVAPVTFPVYIQADYLGTTLTAAITSTTQSPITVADATNLVNGTIFWIDSECLSVNGTPTGTSVPVNRGVNGTTAATHLIDALVIVTVEFNTAADNRSNPSAPDNNPFTGGGINGRVWFLCTTASPHGMRTGWQCTISFPPGGIPGPVVNMNPASYSTPLGGTTLTANITDSYAATTTLSSNVTSTAQTNIPVTDGTNIVNGNVILVGNEMMTVVSGGGTSGPVSLDVHRNTPAGNGASTYSSGAVVYPASEITVATASSGMQTGNQIQIDSEQMVCIYNPSGSPQATFYVGRGYNGTSPNATHSSGAGIFPVIWPREGSNMVLVVSPTQFISWNFFWTLPGFAPTSFSTIDTSAETGYTLNWLRPTQLGMYPPQLAAQFASNLADSNPSGQCFLWCGVPFMCTDNGVTTYINNLIPYLSSGVSLIFQLSNEIWNTIFIQWAMAGSMGNAAPNPTTWSGNLYDGYGFAYADDYIAYRQNHITTVARAAFAAAGLNPERVPFFQASQFAPTDANDIISICQNNTYEVNYYAYAPYFAMPGNTAIADLFASWLPTSLGGTASWNAQTFRRLILARLRALFWWSTFFTGKLIGCNQALAQYNGGIAVGSTNGATGTPNPAIAAGHPSQVVFYEFNGFAPALPDAGNTAWRAAFTAAQTGALTHDLTYDPAAYYTELAYLGALQQQPYNLGLNISPNLVPTASATSMIPAFGCYFQDTGYYQVGNGWGADTAYPIYTYLGQKGGYGDGTGTISVNQNTYVNVFWYDESNYVDGAWVSAPKIYDYRNDSPRGLALQSWNASIPTPSQISSLYSSGFGCSGFAIASFAGNGVLTPPSAVASLYSSCFACAGFAVATFAGNGVLTSTAIPLFQTATLSIGAGGPFLQSGVNS